MSLDLELLPVLSGRRVVVAWLLTAFLVTFLVTRFVTHTVRTGRGPFRDASVGGVHIHHEVYGIALLLVTGWSISPTGRTAPGSTCSPGPTRSTPRTCPATGRSPSRW